MARPTREELIAKLEELGEKALTAERNYIGKNGEPVTYSQPDFKAAIETVRLTAELCGYLGKAQGEGQQTAEAEVERRINALRKRAA